MVGYPESLTDPSYTGQILVLTFPLVGNYGVPDRKAVLKELENLPKYFESEKIHVAALVVSRYSEDFSHYLAQCSLSSWLKEQGIPAIHGIDTRALTKKIRSQGVMLGKVLFPKQKETPSLVVDNSWMQNYVDIPWSDPNATNLVAAGTTPDEIRAGR